MVSNTKPHALIVTYTITVISLRIFVIVELCSLSMTTKANYGTYSLSQVFLII